MQCAPTCNDSNDVDDKQTIKALVVDDEKVVRDFLTRFLSLKGTEAKAVEDELEAIEAVKKDKFDIVFLELSQRTHKTDATAALRELKEINPHGEYVIMATHLDEDLWEEAKKQGAAVCFKKPFDLDELMLEINRIRRLRDVF